MQSDNRLLFRWEKRGERYVFLSEFDLQGDPDQYNEQLTDILRWCKEQRLRPDQYRFEARRSAVSEKTELFELDGKRAGFSGGTIFHPTRLKVELDLPDSHGVMFTMAFRVSDDRARG